MNVRQLRDFYAAEMGHAQAEGVLLSLHLKSTMMRVSDPIIFGHCVSVYYQDVLNKHAAELRDLGVNPDNGVAELHTKIQSLPERQTGGNRSGYPGGLRLATRTVNGQLRPRHHQLARTQRRDH